MAGRAADANALRVGRQLPDCFVQDFPVPPHDDTAVNLTNPTVPTFMLAILPQFVDSCRPVRLECNCWYLKGTGLLTLGSAALASSAVGGWLSRHGCWYGRSVLQTP
ncbi:hypothetical protein [Allomesorhizobium camelthorni]|uniref:Uncharacterized protein n=1 Tax=Allomesorhizobium camelthorni TaxID=475069 RepID=A0A6G4W9U9_9HYPH|nr:hypothetical protein [Mesorhizobium camelthorni]NGO50930.1 hypothetical protein [Mesorhizobium camelthorni]